MFQVLIRSWRFAAAGLSGAMMLAMFSANPAWAQAPGDCATKAIDKNGKPLAGAAKTAFMKKCEASTPQAAAAAKCAGQAVSKTGKPLAGAAKAAFMKKCEADALATGK